MSSSRRRHASSAPVHPWRTAAPVTGGDGDGGTGEGKGESQGGGTGDGANGEGGGEGVLDTAWSMTASVAPVSGG